MAPFRFKKFSLSHDKSTMKIGTDAVLLAALTDAANAQSVLDVGCGCGVIGFCIAQQLAHNQIFPYICGVDTDENSIVEARQNATNYPLLSPDIFHFIHGRVQDLASVDQPKKFDLIVSNPPFFGNDLKPTDASRLKSKHRDAQLSFEELLDSVLKLLNPEGRFALILPKTEGEEFDRLASEKLFCRKRVFLQPTAKKPIHRVIQEYSQEEGPCEEHLLIIRNEKNEYTEDYKKVVKPYLL